MTNITAEYKKVITLLDNSKGLGIRPGLTAIEGLLSLMGDPHKGLKYIHIAGTNGKGSTSAFIASILIEAGYKVGVYNSPYTSKINETIKINNKEISDSELLAIILKISSLIEGSGLDKNSYPTEFEIITSAALMYFCQESCDLVVLEVGMGGRLDATNIIPCPEVAVITPIGMDHMGFLGNTLEAISYEKSGIIKSQGTVISSQQEKEALEVIKRVSEEKKASLKVVNNKDIFIEEEDITGQTLSYKDYMSLKITLLGKHQRENAALAVEAIEVLINNGYSISRKDLYQGLLKATWPGRFQIMRKEKPLFIRDGAHNIQGAQALHNTLIHYFPDKKITFILGFLRDKSFKEILELIGPIAKTVFLVTPNSPRALSAEELAEAAGKYFNDIHIVKDIDRTVEYLIKEAGDDEIICAFGSLYFIGEIEI